MQSAQMTLTIKIHEHVEKENLDSIFNIINLWLSNHKIRVLDSNVESGSTIILLDIAYIVGAGGGCAATAWFVLRTIAGPYLKKLVQRIAGNQDKHNLENNSTIVKVEPFIDEDKETYNDAQVVKNHYGSTEITENGGIEKVPFFDLDESLHSCVSRDVTIEHSIKFKTKDASLTVQNKIDRKNNKSYFEFTVKSEMKFK